MKLELRESTVGAYHVMWPRGGGGFGAVTPWEEHSQPPQHRAPQAQLPPSLEFTEHGAAER